jgi:hypothetical protein
MLSTKPNDDSYKLVIQDLAYFEELKKSTWLCTAWKPRN